MPGKRSKPSHTPGTRTGEKMSAGQGGSGRYETGSKGAGRPAGKSTASNYTGINADAREPIDPKSPDLIPA